MAARAQSIGTASLPAETPAPSERAPRGFVELRVRLAAERIARRRPAQRRAERPCFFYRDCGRQAELEKQGKALCRACAIPLGGIEYPLRAPSRDPLYWDADELAKQLGMKGYRRRDGARPALAFAKAADDF